MNVDPRTDAPRYRANPDIVACSLGEAGSALLDLRSNTYFSLDPVGEAVWAALSSPTDAPASSHALCEVVAREFETTPNGCRDDIDRLLTELRLHDLIGAIACEAEPSDASE